MSYMSQTQRLGPSSASVHDDPLVFACMSQSPKRVRLYADQVFEIYDRDDGWPDEKAQGLTKFQVLEQHVNRKDDLGRSPLCAAAYMCQPECCKILLESGAHVSDKDKSWLRPLHWACIGGCEESSKLLLEKSKDFGLVNAVDRRMRQSPLHMAAANGHHDLCEVLVRHVEDNSKGITMKKSQLVNFQDRHGRTPIHLAAYNGYEMVLKTLLEHDGAGAKADKSGRTALHWAAHRGHQPVVVLLLSAFMEVDANVDGADSKGFTALHAATIADSVVCLQTLVKGGADVGVRDNRGRTALHLAAANGCIDSLRLLLHFAEHTAAADINGTDNSGQTALHKAAATDDSGTEIVIEMLLESGMDINLADNKGRTALHLACRGGNLESIFLLLSEAEEAADINAPDVAGNTCLHVAARFGHEAALTLLVRYGADVNTSGRFGMTALHVAARHGNADCVRTLLEKEARADPLDADGRTPLHAAGFNGSGQSAAILIEAGTLAGVVDRFGRTALHYAASSNGSKVCEVVLEALAGQAAFPADGRGRTPMHYAAVVDDVCDCIKLLSDSGGSITAGDRRHVTPMHLACLNGHKDTVEWLLEKLDSDEKVAAAVNALDSSNRSPLHYAAFGGHPAVLNVLLETDGVAADAGDVLGQTPLFAAAANGCCECVDLLLEAGADGNHMDVGGRIPAMVAALHSNDETATAACFSGAVDDAKRTTLMMAAHVGSSKCVEIMVAQVAATPDAVDLTGMNALHIALSSAGRSKKTYETEALNEIVELLLAKVPPEAKDRYGRNAVHIAAIHGLEEALALLIENGFTNELDVFGHTPLHYACYHGHDECVGALTDEEVQWQHEAENVFGPLHCAASQGQTECLQALFDDASESLDVNGLDTLGRAPIHLAAAGGHNDGGGSSVLHLCMAPSAPAGGGAVVRAILDSLERDSSNAADVAAFLNRPSQAGDTVLHLASEQHDLETIQALLSRGARSDCADADGHLPVHRLFKTEESRDCLAALLPPPGCGEGLGLPTTIRISTPVEDVEGGPDDV
eukprot:gene5628-910_t